MTIGGLSVGGVGAGAQVRVVIDNAPSPEDPALGTLRAVAADERVHVVKTAVREAYSEPRWNETLRRRQREAHAETMIWDTIASGDVGGVVVSAEVLRKQVIVGSLTQVTIGDPDLDAVAGLWCVGTRLVGWMPDLAGQGRPVVPSARSLLVALYRGVVDPPVAGGRADLGEVSVSRAGQVPAREGGLRGTPQGEELAARLTGLVDLIETPQAPALARAAVVRTEMLAVRLSTAGNAMVGRLLVRHLLARDGLEPTGVVVIDLYPGWVPAVYAKATRAYVLGTIDGMMAQVVWQTKTVLAGVQEAQRLCRAVQADTWRTG